MFFRSLVITFILLIGSGTVNSLTQFKQQVSVKYEAGNYIEYVWIDGVRWAIVYTDEGNLVDKYPDPE